MVNAARKLASYYKCINRKPDLTRSIMGSFPKNRNVAFKYEGYIGVN